MTFIVKPVSQVEWNEWSDDQTKERPDVTDQRVLKCEKCTKEDPQIIFTRMANEAVMFKAFCLHCKHKSEAVRQEGAQEKFHFGKFKDKSFEEVYAKEPSYLNWCAQNLSSTVIRERVAKFLAKKAV